MSLISLLLLIFRRFAEKNGPKRFGLLMGGQVERTGRTFRFPYGDSIFLTDSIFLLETVAFMRGP
jgi:hypothetical protein